MNITLFLLVPSIIRFFFGFLFFSLVFTSSLQEGAVLHYLIIHHQTKARTGVVSFIKVTLGLKSGVLDENLLK